MSAAGLHLCGEIEFWSIMDAVDLNVTPRGESASSPSQPRRARCVQREHAVHTTGHSLTRMYYTSVSSWVHADGDGSRETIGPLEYLRTRGEVQGLYAQPIQRFFGDGPTTRARRAVTALFRHFAALVQKTDNMQLRRRFGDVFPH